MIATSAQAVMVLDIVENGPSSTIWRFSGSAVAGNNGFFENGTNLADDDTWQNLGDFTTVNDFENQNVNGVATLTIGTNTRQIDLAYIDNDGPLFALDDIGVGVSGNTVFNFSAGDEVSWDGSLVVNGIGLDDLSERTLPIVFTTSNYGGLDNTLAFSLRIAAPVPVPTALIMILSGLAGLGWVGRRRVG